MGRTTIETPRPSVIPPLQNGDRLTREEFERRYDATPDLKKAELINGIVYMPPPVSHHYHGKPHILLGTLIGVYSAATAGTECGDNSSVRLNENNMPQPDLYLMVRTGGQARIDEEGYVVGATEFVAEVAASSASYDLHSKMEVYRQNDVREYIVWRTYDGEIDYFILREGRYEKFAADASGVWRSECFPGLWVDGKSLLAGDIAAALKVLEEGIQTPGHLEFVGRLRV
jgi:Uma2 family endonuclease